jgi:hypothetical protein
MAHELGEPLTAIYNCFDEMQQAFQPGRLAPESIARSIEQASSQIARSAGGVLLLRYLANGCATSGQCRPTAVPELISSLRQGSAAYHHDCYPNLHQAISRRL